MVSAPQLAKQASPKVVTVPGTWRTGNAEQPSKQLVAKVPRVDPEAKVAEDRLAQPWKQKESIKVTEEGTTMDSKPLLAKAFWPKVGRLMPSAKVIVDKLAQLLKLYRDKVVTVLGTLKAVNPVLAKQ